MSDDISDFYVHTVTVETFQGAGPYGDSYAAPATVTCFIEGKIHLVRNKDGEQVVSNSTVYCSTTDAARFTTDSKVTDSSGRVSRVITVNVNDAPGLRLPEHAAINLV